jgi:putative transposase
LDWEKETVISYAKSHIAEGYRRLTYIMMDEDIVAVSLSPTYRILKSAGLHNRWNIVKKNSKGKGFDQPIALLQHFYVDIKYINFKGPFPYFYH